jgi:hypothetical protein
MIAMPSTKHARSFLLDCVSAFLPLVVRPSLLVASMALAACASSTTTGSQVIDAATLRADWARDSVLVWRASYVSAVDDKFVDREGAYPSVKVDPGERVLAIAVRFNQGPGSGGPFESEVRLVADLKARGIYQVRSRAVGFEIEAWLEEEGSGARVGEPARAIFSKAPPQRSTIPVLIPGGGVILLPGPAPR